MHSEKYIHDSTDSTDRDDWSSLNQKKIELIKHKKWELNSLGLEQECWGAHLLY